MISEFVRVQALELQMRLASSLCERVDDRRGDDG